MKMYTDDEYLAHLQEKIDSSSDFVRCLSPLSSLVCDDQYMYRVLSNPDRLRTCVCGGNIRHDIKSVCAGHGDFPRYVVITCNRCGVTVECCLDYGGSYSTARQMFLDRCYRFASVYRDVICEVPTDE